MPVTETPSSRRLGDPTVQQLKLSSSRLQDEGRSYGQSAATSDQSGLRRLPQEGDEPELHHGGTASSPLADSSKLPRERYGKRINISKEGPPVWTRSDGTQHNGYYSSPAIATGRQLSEAPRHQLNFGSPFNEDNFFNRIQRKGGSASALGFEGGGAGNPRLG
ncbi:MAG: hypothetical protein Q9220_007759 [cf. Caloplaca sp. 1 TL-2023]